MSADDPIIVKINKKLVRYSGSTGQEVKRQVRNADILINNEGTVIKERAGLGHRRATAAELKKATELSI